MKFPHPLRSARFIKRYKRFFTEAELEGLVVVAHTPNTGTMKTCLAEGCAVFLSKPPPNPKAPRKLEYTLELSQIDGAFIGVNTSRTNSVVHEALLAGKIKELGVIENVRAEYSLGESRFDFYYEQKGRPALIEVKNVTLKGPQDWALFPDAVSTRALKHIEEMAHWQKQGYQCTFLFVVARSDVARFAPAWKIDPKYAQALKEAVSVGVRVLAYQTKISVEEMILDRPLPVDLSVVLES